MTVKPSLSYDLCLASASPRRSQLVRQLGIEPLIFPVDIDESVQPFEAPETYVGRLAIEKAAAGYQRHGESLPTLGSDTCVVIDQQILGKPRNLAHCIEMLQQLSGRTHQVYTGVAIVTEQHSRAIVQKSDVTFASLSPKQCERYWHTGEPCDKAGAYGIQGIGSVFVKHINGSFSGVMGLPIYETAGLLREANIPIIAI